MNPTHTPHTTPPRTPRRCPRIIRAAASVVPLLALLLGWWGWQAQRHTAVAVRVFTGHRGQILSVAISPDGQYALSASGDTLQVWDVATGEAVRTFTGHRSTVRSVAVSPDGQFALSSACGVWGEFGPCMQGELRLWAIATGDPVRTFASPTGEIWSIAFSPDGQYALSGACGQGDEDSPRCTQGELRLWDITTGESVRTFTGHEGGVLSVAVSPDGQFALSGANDGTLRLWDVATGATVRVFVGHEDTVRSVAFSPDGQFALSGAADATLRLWEIALDSEEID